MLKEEIRLIKNTNINTLDRFDINKHYKEWLHEYAYLFDEPAPLKIKKLIKKTRILWIKDEFALFRILSKDYLKDGFICPKCKSDKGFIPTRYKKIDKMFKVNRCVRAEKPRTLSCNNCSFTFNPLSLTPYRNLKLDLRKWVFCWFISEDGKIDYPVSSISRIIDVSYYTAKKIKTAIINGERKFSDKEKDKYISNKSEDHPMINIILQASELWKK